MYSYVAWIRSLQIVYRFLCGEWGRERDHVNRPAGWDNQGMFSTKLARETPRKVPATM